MTVVRADSLGATKPLPLFAIARPPRKFGLSGDADNFPVGDYLPMAECCGVTRSRCSLGSFSSLPVTAARRLANSNPNYRQCIVDGPGVPSDQVPAKTMKTVTLSSGSFPAITGEPGRLAPQLFTASPETKNMRWGMPAHVVVAQILLLRHHVAPRSRSQHGQFCDFQGGRSSREDLWFRFSRQHEFGFLQKDGQKRL
jgi:hypothetical protein